MSQPPVATSTRPALSKSGPGGLSSGAVAGLGVGVAVGILILAAAAFFIIRSRRQRGRLPPTEARDSSDATVQQCEDIHRKLDFPQHNEMAVYERPTELPT